METEALARRPVEPVTLDDHLGAALKVAMTRRGNHGAVVDRFRKAMASDPAMAKAAEKRKIELERLEANCLGQLERRDVISHHHLRVLRDALKPEGKTT